MNSNHFKAAGLHAYVHEKAASSPGSLLSGHLRVRDVCTCRPCISLDERSFHLNPFSCHRRR